MSGEPFIDLLRRDRIGRTRAEWFFQDGIFGSVVIGGGEMCLGILHGHLGKLAEGDGLPSNRFWQFDLAPYIGFVLLLECECIAVAADSVTVLLAVNVVIDRALEYAFELWSAVSLHSASDVPIVPTSSK
jgi:hypothetical protein